MKPNLPRTEWLDLAVMSRDDHDYRNHWGTIIDEENFARLDAEVPDSGPLADRPDEAPYHGAKYHATDVNAVFSWDQEAEEWTVLNAGTCEDPLPGTVHLDTVEMQVARTASSPVIDVTHPDYGAVGDGETDDLAALQAATEAAEYGGVVFLPNGEYAVSDTWDIPYDAVTVVANPGASVVASEEMSAVVAHSGSDYTIRGLEIDANELAARGLRLEGTDKTIRNCRVVDCRALVDDGLTVPYGIWDRGGRTTIDDCVIERVYGLEDPDESEYETDYPGSSAGIQSSTSDEGHEGDVTITNCTIRDVRYVADADGVRVGVEHSSEVVVTGNLFHNVHKSDVKVQGDQVENVVVSDNVMLFDDPDYETYAGVRIQTGNAIVSNNVIDFESVGADSAAFVIAKDEDVIVEGNDCTFADDSDEGGFDGIRIFGNDDSDEPVEDVVVADNNLSGPVRFGVYLRFGYSTVAVDDNIIEGPTSHGIFSSDENDTAEWLRVTSNTIATDAEGACVRLERGDPVLVDGNMCRAGGGLVDADEGTNVVEGTNYDQQS